MNKSLAITGMSCEHCVSQVKAALEGMEGVTRADVSLEESQADITLSADVPDADLVAAVETAGYQAEAR